MSKQFWGVIAVIVLIFVGIFILGGKGSESDKASNVSASQHVQGNPKATVTLVEYGDYQCPYCGQYYPTIKQVQAKYNDQIKFQFRNYPLVNIHQNAFAGSRAAEAAALQNKFWEMHDMLYERQSEWSSTGDPLKIFKQYATALGLNATQFATDYNSDKVNATINADTAEGNKLKVEGTPAFFVNGKAVQIANSPEAFDKVINEALSKQKVENSGATSQTTGTSSSSSNGSTSDKSTTTSGQ